MIRRVSPSRLVFLDESGLNVSMTRSHAWVKRGCEYIERTPMNWGKNLTLLGAMRLTGWVLLTTMFASTNKERFVDWLAKKLLPKLQRGDVLLLDNLSAHHDERVVTLCAARGVRVIYLPPYSHDFNPIEPGWGLQKQQVRRGVKPRNFESCASTCLHSWTGEDGSVTNASCTHAHPILSHRPIGERRSVLCSAVSWR